MLRLIDISDSSSVLTSCITEMIINKRNTFYVQSQFIITSIHFKMHNVEYRGQELIN